MDLRKVIQIVIDNKAMIILITLFATLSAALGYFISPAKYSASTTVYMKPGAAKILMEKGESKNLTEVSSVGLQYISQTYKLLFQSRFLLESTVRILNLDKPKEPTGFRKKIQDIFNPIKEPLEKSIYYILYGMYNPDPFEKAVKKLEKRLKVKQNLKTYLYTITVKDKDPKLAADTANTIATEFVKYSGSVNASEATTYREFLEQRINILGKELEQAQKALKAFKDQYRISDLKEETKLDLNSLSSFEKDFDDTDIEIKETEMLQKEIATDKYSKKLDDAVRSSTEKKNSILDDLRTDLAKAEVDLKSLEEKYTDSNRKVTEQKVKIEDLKEKIKKQVNEIMDSLNAKKKLLGNVIKKYESAMLLTPMKQKKLDEFELEIEVAKNSYKKINDQYEDARLEESQKLNEIRVIDKAKPPLYPKWPMQVLYPLFGLFGGLMVSIGLVLFLEYMDDSVRTIEDAERILGYPVLATIPKLKTRK